MGDPQVVGYAMWLAKDEKTFNVVSISNNKDGNKIAAGLWQGFLKQEGWKHSVDAKVLDGRTTQLLLDAQGDHAERPLFLIGGALGHGIAL